MPRSNPIRLLCFSLLCVVSYSASHEQYCLLIEEYVLVVSVLVSVGWIEDKVIETNTC